MALNDCDYLAYSTFIYDQAYRANQFKIRQKFPVTVKTYNTFVLPGGAIALQPNLNKS